MAKAKEEYWRTGPSPDSARVHTETGQEPGVDVSNADVDLSSLSQDSAFSTVVPATEQNPEEHRPAPGPQRVEVLGVGAETEEPVTGQLEGTRSDASDSSGSKPDADGGGSK